METITLGGGCFWCLDAVYREIEGVTSSTCGYAGGDVAEPSYEAVCSGKTGHAEVVQVTFDPQVTDLATILQIFFSLHDPTTKDRQGADVGTQYRSAIFTGSEHEAAARQAIEDAQGFYDAPIVTEVAPLQRFWPAEAYHQDYYNNNPGQGYCAAVISPKVGKMRQLWAHKLRTTA